MASKLKTNIYNVYYRQRHNNLLFSEKKLDKFQKIKNPFGRWAADPFVITYNEKSFIFAEMAGISSRKGDIYYLELDSKNPKWKRCIKNKYHMSFPNVFSLNNCFYMVPETANDKTVSLYKALQMPNKWYKEKELFCDNDGVHPVDNICLPFANKPFEDAFITYIKRNNRNYLCLYERESNRFVETHKIEDEKLHLRPAGKIFSFENRLFFPSQNCERQYGGGLIINEIVFDNDRNFYITPLFEINPQDVKLSKLSRNCVGIHTYNFNEKYEVIDIISNHFSLLACFGKIVRVIKRIFHIKS